MFWEQKNGVLTIESAFKNWKDSFNEVKLKKQVRRNLKQISAYVGYFSFLYISMSKMINSINAE